MRTRLTIQGAALGAAAILIFSSAGAQDEHGGHGSGMEKSGAQEPSGAHVETPGSEMEIAQGRMIYAMVCVHCHGAKGKGDGPASMFIGPYSHPRPNDFSQGTFKFRSTESGELPTLSDLMRTIRQGIPGFMPSFRNLGIEQIRAVALYIRSEFIKEELPTQTTILYAEHAGPYVYSMDSVRRGEKLYNEMKCFECHGADGRGAGGLLKDERGLAIHPVDLTRPETFGNGISHADIYRTIMTGLDGTPMPGYSDSFTGKENNAWDLVHYILFLQEK
jgi:cytochrome c oxidase cbb3-type subunit I/II